MTCLKASPAYVSKPKSNYEKETILIMILYKEEWHCLTVKKLSELWSGDFWFSLFELPSFVYSKKDLNFMNKFVETENFKWIEFRRILDACKNNPGKLFKSKVAEKVPSGIHIISSFKNTRYKHIGYRNENYMKRFANI